jgi:hypothetical protein
VLHSRLRGIDEHPGIAGPEPTLPLEQIRKAITLGLRLDPEESAETLLVEQPW